MGALVDFCPLVRWGQTTTSAGIDLEVYPFNTSRPIVADINMVRLRVLG